MRQISIACLCCVVAFCFPSNRIQPSLACKSPSQRSRSAADTNHLLFPFGEGDSFQLALAQRPEVPREWREAIRTIRDPEAFLNAAGKWRAQWKRDEEHDLFIQKDYELLDKNGSLQIVNQITGRVINANALFSRHNKNPLFSRRLCVVESKEWTVVAVCNDVPSDIEVHCINSKRPDSTFSFTSTCLTFRSLQGRHFQVFSLTISDGRIEVYSASTAGVNVDVVEFGSGKSSLRFAIGLARE